MNCYSAAFGRLRVETPYISNKYNLVFSAAFGRLRVETSMASTRVQAKNQPPSGGCELKRAG